MCIVDIIILLYDNNIIITHAVNRQTLGNCSASIDCVGASGDVLGAMTLQECCLNTFGLAFIDFGSESCTTCIGIRTSLLYAC